MLSKTDALTTKLAARRLILALLVLGLLPWAAGADDAGDTATALRAGELHALPANGSDVVGSYAAGDTLSVHARRGLWLEVSHGEQRAWARLTRLRMSSGVPATGSQPGNTLTRLSRSLSGLLGGMRRRDNMSAHDTLGIRGLTAAELETAPFDAAALGAVTAATVKPADAAQFAAAGGLATRTVPDVPAAGTAP